MALLMLMRFGLNAALMGGLLLTLAAPVHAGALRVGDRFPVTAVSDWQGAAVALAAPPSGVMIVDFWASWCQPCRAALPELNAIARRHAGSGLHVVAINIDKSQAPADSFLKTYVAAPAMRLLRDPNGAQLARFGAAGMPALYVVDSQGVVRAVESGFTADRLRTVEELVVQLLEADEYP